MQIQFQLQLGGKTFTIVETANTQKELFEKMAFLQSLPQSGPNGETDLTFQHRVAQGKYDYYSIVSKTADQEFLFGQLNEEPDRGRLFPKGWQPIYKAEQAASDVPAGVVSPPTQTAAPAVQAPAAAPQVAAPAPATPAPQAAPAQPAAPAVNPADVLNKFGI